MAYNLIETPWIPVKTSSGAVSKIEPWRLTEHMRQDPIERLYAARPDFNAALVQFLIGLVQTTMPPEDEDDWLERLEKPPKPEVLRKSFSDWSQAFNLDGASPRFMQDFDELAGENKSVSGLLIESPGEKTIEDNKDHFIKRDTVNKLCPSCAATSLLTLQINAPSGGVGHRTSIRGGGPLSTILVDVNQPLWNTISLNTLPKNLFERNVGGNPDLVNASDIFPWLAKTRGSDSNGGKDTTPLDVNPLQIFWAMPRRIRLKVEEDTEALCDLCHEASRKIIKTYVTKNYGINYVGHWNHFLTPHYRDKDSVLHPRHASSKGITYRDWLGLIVNDQEKGYEAAYRIRQFLESDYCEDKQLRLWAFGFDMDNMKAKCWYEGVMPIITVSVNIREKYENETMRLVKSAQAVGANLTSAIKKSWFTRTSEIKSDLSMVDRLFWIRTEPIFYGSLNLLRESLEKKEPNEGVLRAWHKKITSQALDIFDETVLSGQFEQEDTKRMVKARNELIKFNWSKKIMEQILELPTKLK